MMKAFVCPAPTTHFHLQAIKHHVNHATNAIFVIQSTETVELAKLATNQMAQLASNVIKAPIRKEGLAFANLATAIALFATKQMEYAYPVTQDIYPMKCPALNALLEVIPMAQVHVKPVVEFATPVALQMDLVLLAEPDSSCKMEYARFVQRTTLTKMEKVSVRNA